MATGTLPETTRKEIGIQEEYSSTTELEIDPAGLTLSAKTPKDITETAHRVIRNSLHRWHTSGDVVHLSHGTFNGKAATLIIFKFRFIYDLQSSARFARAEVRLNFFPHGDEGGGWPSVKQFGPRLIHSFVTLGEVTTSRSTTASASVNAAPVPASAGVEFSVTHVKSSPAEYRTEVIGEPWTSDEADEQDVEEDDSVHWRMVEHKQQADGIPRALQCAVIVQSEDAAFEATVQVKVKTSSGLALFAWPWSRPRPLVFRKQVSFGAGPEVTRFDEIPEQAWLDMIGVDRPYTRIQATEKHAERPGVSKVY
ncbi:hypothetical protein MPH_09235 [Macrophomina phaseolina MS6]|uniref:Uncharacterized protein n=1 Tax=Macrophomina phaseolina (strain MS6) TaxID=1126212 RepID=K2QVC9_MACPH|nr:hypothetical protein MPH_09235 [Macrophomina phaseolina MS6]